MEEIKILMKKNYKCLLAQLKRAEIYKKKNIIVSISKISFMLLNFLWSEKFIYGYHRISSTYAIIFLKQNYLKIKSFNTIHIDNQGFFNRKLLQSFYFFNKTYFYIVLTKKGIFSLRYCVKKKLGGSIIGEIIKGV